MFLVLSRAGPGPQPQEESLHPLDDDLDDNIPLSELRRRNRQAHSAPNEEESSSDSDNDGIWTCLGAKFRSKDQVDVVEKPINLPDIESKIAEELNAIRFRPSNPWGGIKSMNATSTTRGREPESKGQVTNSPARHHLSSSTLSTSIEKLLSEPTLSDLYDADGRLYREVVDIVERTVNHDGVLTLSDDERSRLPSDIITHLTMLLPSSVSMSDERTPSRDDPSRALSHSPRLCAEILLSLPRLKPFLVQIQSSPFPLAVTPQLHLAHLFAPFFGTRFACDLIFKYHVRTLVEGAVIMGHTPAVLVTKRNFTFHTSSCNLSGTPYSREKGCPCLVSSLGIRLDPQPLLDDDKMAFIRGSEQHNFRT